MLFFCFLLSCRSSVALWTLCAYLGRFLRPGMARSVDPDRFLLKKPQIHQPGQIFEFWGRPGTIRTETAKRRPDKTPIFGIRPFLLLTGVLKEGMLPRHGKDKVEEKTRACVYTKIDQHTRSQGVHRGKTETSTTSRSRTRSHQFPQLLICAIDWPRLVFTDKRRHTMK